ncbi:hypothetical protein K4K51_007478 [Colletotrichum sp. SAR 10_75]|nr:hypothetical protein K4K51_007478 [Colletotrichum sp. SAR 10_75]
MAHDGPSWGARHPGPVVKASEKITVADNTLPMGHAALLKQGKKLATKAATQAVKDAMSENKTKKRKQSDSAIGNKNDPVDGIIRVAASIVGLVSEVVQYRRDRKESEANQIVISDEQLEDASVMTPEQINESIWRRDDEDHQTNQIPTQGPTENKASKEPADLAQAFLKRHPSPSEGRGTSTRIELPVVVPQRRPKKRARGFVRAYTPILANADIDEGSFLDFIDTFNKALEPNPYLYAMNLAGLAGMATPEPFMLVVGVAVAFATDATMEAQSRSKSAKFLDHINKDFFMPRGLICLITTWKPDASDELMTPVGFDGRVIGPPLPKADVDFLQTMRNVKEKTSTDAIMKSLQRHVKRRTQPSSGDFYSPEPAPLVFPTPEQTAEAMKTHSNGKRKNALDRGEVWFDDFMDRRAQAKWIERNPTFTVASSLPRPEFRSRYADPTHPAASGDIVAFVTGGNWSTKGKTFGRGHYSQPTNDKDGQPDEAEPVSETAKQKKKATKGSKTGWMGLLQKVRSLMGLSAT